MSTSTYCI